MFLTWKTTSNLFSNEGRPQYSFELNQQMEDDLKIIVQPKIIKNKNKQSELAKLALPKKIKLGPTIDISVNIH